MEISEYLKPGDLFTSLQPAVYKTVLGSCISICLYDKRLKMGGMNHFIFDTPRGKKPSDKYGDTSTVNLINQMLKLGSKPADLVASVYGGASGFSNAKIKSPGSKNIEIANRILKERSIPIVDSDTGGCYGRTVLFHSDSNTISVLKLDNCLRFCNKKEDCLACSEC